MCIELQLTLSFSKLAAPKLLRNHQTDACYRWSRRSISLERNARAESASILFPSGPLFLPPPIPVSRSCAVSSTGICGFERKERTNADVFIAFEFFFTQFNYTLNARSVFRFSVDARMLSNFRKRKATRACCTMYDCLTTGFSGAKKSRFRVL